MARAIAIAVTQENPYKAAIDSAGNFMRLAFDAMYGTQKRIRYTMAIALTLFTLEVALNTFGHALLQSCPV